MDSQSVTLSRTIIGAIAIGNVLEWHDFAAYGYVASVLAGQFLPGTDHVASLIAAFSVFALGFVGRVGGSFLYGLISDRHGRGTALRTSIVLMAIPTTLIGCLPTYRTVGVLAPLLLVARRLFQGLSVGGEFTTSLTMMAEVMLPARRGLGCGLIIDRDRLARIANLVSSK